MLKKVKWRVEEGWHWYQGYTDSENPFSLLLTKRTLMRMKEDFFFSDQILELKEEGDKISVIDHNGSMPYEEELPRVETLYDFGVFADIRNLEVRS